METTPSFTDREALQAVRDRDASYDGRLFFAVITTGIYCRPSCSARQAKTENLRFFNNSQSAVAAGFRACKRCKPDNPTGEGQIVEIARYIEAHADEKLTLSVLSERFGISPTHLQKAFTASFGISPKSFQDGVRQQKFKSLLKKGESVTDAVFAAGYGSSSRVYESSDNKLGMTPGAYKAGASGEQISYTCGETSVGKLLLAATDKGVCFAMFAPTESQLVQMLQHEFPQASISQAPDNAQIDRWFAEINQCLSAGKYLPVIPLDMRGTAFQIRVWQFLQSIANGEVVSYSDVAVGIKQPSAFRAAASACGKNRIALLIPCHRVLRGDGSMGGYRWGVKIKQALLELEKSPEDTGA